MKTKIFHDTVHGSIPISSDYCKEIIDTILFQRLRRIEQTSMRSLYPCARHDRFIHSLGVFYLGCQLVTNLEQNLKTKQPKLWKDIKGSWDIVATSYKIACLLHDVGHAPFSHTFELYFDYQQVGNLNTILTRALESETFSQDLNAAAAAAQHEKVSAYLAVKHFKSAINKLQGNAEYVARMITGCRFFLPKTDEQQLVNCLISVLHGEIDVDRLDYALRDQWAAGFTSSRLNIARLLRAIIIIRKNGILELCFFKGAMDQIEALIQIKDFQKKWIFRHQNIQYDQDILNKAITKLAEYFGEKEKTTSEEILKKIFSIEVFENENYIVCGHNLYLLTDDTLIHLLKQTLSKNEYAREWLSRSYTKQPLWKSDIEYRRFFKETNPPTKQNICIALSHKNLLENDYTVIDTSYAPYIIPQRKVLIYVNDELVDYYELAQNVNIKPSNVPYLFVSKDVLKKISKSEIIETLQHIRV